jgi:tetratricopeptide (TPR) repeat protein
MQSLFLYSISHRIISYLLCAISFSVLSVHAKKSSVEQQITDLKLSLEHDGNNVSILLKLSRALLRVKRYTEALTYLKRIEALPQVDKKSQAKVTYFLAFTYRQTQQYPQAIDAYRLFIKQVEAKLNVNDAYFGLGKTYELMGDTTAAIEAFETFVSLEKRESEKKWVALAQKSIKRLKAQVVSINPKNDDEVLVLDVDDEESSTSTTSPIQEDQSGIKDTKKTKMTNKSSTPTNTSSTKMTSKEVKKATSSSSLTKTNKHPTILSLNEADQAFAQGKYQMAHTAYTALIPSLIQQKASMIEIQQIQYQSAVSAFLAQNYIQALNECEQALILGQHPMLESLATLSYAFKKDRPGTWDDIQLALREARFTHAIDLITMIDVKTLTIKQRAVLNRAQGKAYMGLHRFEDAYTAFKQSGTQFSHVLLDLELAQAAEALQNYKAAKDHYRSIVRKLEKPNQHNISLLFNQAKQSLKRLSKGR